jgi:hypothetical protein
LKGLFKHPLIYQRTGKLFWWRKPNPPDPSLINLSGGTPDTPSSYVHDLIERALRSYDHGKLCSSLEK